jgi:hypothetical protein
MPAPAKVTLIEPVATAEFTVLTILDFPTVYENACDRLPFQRPDVTVIILLDVNPFDEWAMIEVSDVHTLSSQLLCAYLPVPEFA